MNADGSQADEGWFGYAGYTMNDAGGVATGQMNNGSAGGQTAAGYNPMKIRIGEDDRIYWVDNSDLGAILASDILATTNQVVICEGSAYGGVLTGPTYDGSPAVSDLSSGGVGFQEFDVAFTTTSNASVWLCDNDYPSWGIWMFHMTNGAADPADSGTQAVTTGGDLAIVSSGGCMVDTNLDIFCGQDRFNDNAFYDSMVFTNWNMGVLPSEGQGFTLALGGTAGEVLWGYGCGVDTTCSTDPSQEGLRDVVINSRTHPTIVAMPMTAGTDFASGSYSGIRLLNVADGSVVTATNGATVQTLTNLDAGQQYACAAWDNVGNLYGGSTSRNVWRVYSPPGPSTNTTAAVVQVNVVTFFTITSITASPTTPGCSTVTINFTAPGSSAPSAFRVIGSPTISGTYSTVAGATITGGSGTYQATFSNCSREFYIIEKPATLPAD